MASGNGGSLTNLTPADSLSQQKSPGRRSQHASSLLSSSASLLTILVLVVSCAMDTSITYCSVKLNTKAILKRTIEMDMLIEFLTKNELRWDCSSWKHGGVLCFTET